MENKCNSSERTYLFQGSQNGDKNLEIFRREHENFQKRFSHILKGKRRPASNRKELVQSFQQAAEELPGSEGLRDLVAAEFSNANEETESFNVKRTHGIQGANAGLQNGLLAISRFAAAYSSILDAVSKAAGPYADIGYQTISIVLIVFVNKKRNDDSLQQHFSRMGRLFPRLEKWTEIYEDITMKELVSRAYFLGITFARSVTEYFSHRWKRVWLALNPVAMSTKFDEIAQNIYEALEEVNAEANQSFHARSQSIERRLTTDNAVLKAELARVQSELEASRIRELEKDKQADDEKFRILEGNLSPNETGSSHPCFDLSLAKRTLKKAFPNAKERSWAVPWSMYTLMTPDRIISHHSFRSWVDIQSSALLFIHGETKRDGRASTAATPCWLSPAAIHIVEHLTESQGHRVLRDRIIYLSCRPDPENSIKKAASVLTMVALKLLGNRKDILRDRLSDFQKLIAAMSPAPSGTSSPSLSSPSYSPTWPYSPSSPGLIGSWSRSDPSISAENGDKHASMYNGDSPVSMLALEQSRLFLKEVLQELGQRDALSLEHSEERITTAYIVLDRIDWINDNLKVKKFLIELASLTRETKSYWVKFAVVAEGRYQNKWNQNLHQNLVDSDKTFEVNMDQRELSDRDMKSGKGQILWRDQ